MATKLSVSMTTASVGLSTIFTYENTQALSISWLKNWFVM